MYVANIRFFLYITKALSIGPGRAYFREPCSGELRRTPLPRTPANKGGRGRPRIGGTVLIQRTKGKGLWKRKTSTVHAYV
jgi:hypothetical protein